MALQGEVKLAGGTPFPDLELSLLTGERVLFPGQPGGKWTVLFLYDGTSCPLCRQQLLEFQKLVRQGRRDNIRVVAAFADDREHVMNAIWDLMISFPIAYGVDAPLIKNRTGAELESENGGIDNRRILISPDGRIAGSSCGGDLCPDNWLRIIDQSASAFGTLTGATG